MKICKNTDDIWQKVCSAGRNNETLQQHKYLLTHVWHINETLIKHRYHLTQVCSTDMLINLCNNTDIIWHKSLLQVISINICNNTYHLTQVYSRGHINENLQQHISSDTRLFYRRINQNLQRHIIWHKPVLHDITINICNNTDIIRHKSLLQDISMKICYDTSYGISLFKRTYDWKSATTQIS